VRSEPTLLRVAWVGGAFLALAAWPGAVASPHHSKTQDGGSRAAICEFRNPSYAGVCTETPAIPEGQTAADACGAILACLNDARCVKTYCEATEIRHGWTLESAREHSEPEPHE
jgi:hypothetical protein